MMIEKTNNTKTKPAKALIKGLSISTAKIIEIKDIIKSKKLNESNIANTSPILKTTPIPNTSTSMPITLTKKTFTCGNLASVLKALRKASVIYNTCNKEKK